MLKSLRIKNIGLIADLSVSFGPGLNILTGETGAGKSMILSALNLVLGERAESDLLRDGEEAATVEAVFDAVSLKSASALFVEQGIEPEDGEFVVRRTLQKEGKSRAFVNGLSVNLALLKQAGETMVDIHGQHEHQALLNRETHLPWLDAYLGLEGEAAEVMEILGSVRGLERELGRLKRMEEDGEAQREFLEFKVAELEKAELVANEEEELDAEHKRLSSAQKIREMGQLLYEKIYEADNSALSMLEEAVGNLSALKDVDPFFERNSSVFSDVAAQVSDAAREIHSFCLSVEDDPQRLEAIEGRIALLEKLKRKYRADISGLLSLLEESKRELASMETVEDDIKRAEEELEKTRGKLLDKAVSLHRKRVKGIAVFKKVVEKELAELNMSGARFEVEIIFPGAADERFSLDGVQTKIFPHGFGEFQFLISANEGQTPRPLVKTASGGEISRTMLALKTAIGKVQPVPVLVFDEIDTGIGGKTADLVGEKLRKLSANCQIFCITHLPQIARQANTHYLVEKAAKGRKTSIYINMLDMNSRVEELARMGAGKEITDAAREHAREMITQKS